MKKHEREAVDRAVREAHVYGCTVHVDTDRPRDGQSHLRLVITEPASGQRLVHTVGGTPKNRGAMVNGVGNAVRRKARALVGLGPK